MCRFTLVKYTYGIYSKIERAYHQKEVCFNNIKMVRAFRKFFCSVGRKPFFFEYFNLITKYDIFKSSFWNVYFT